MPSSAKPMPTIQQQHGLTESTIVQSNLYAKSSSFAVGIRSIRFLMHFLFSSALVGFACGGRTAAFSYSEYSSGTSFRFLVVVTSSSSLLKMSPTVRRLRLAGSTGLSAEPGKQGRLTQTKGNYKLKGSLKNSTKDHMLLSKIVIIITIIINNYTTYYNINTHTHTHT